MFSVCVFFLSVFSACVFSLCVFSLCVFSLCVLSLYVFCLCFPSVFSLCMFSVCVFLCLCVLCLCVFCLCVFSLCFLCVFFSVFSVCVFCPCFLLVSVCVFFLCFLPLCVFCLCFLSVLSPCVFSFCVLSLCVVSVFSPCVFSFCFLSGFAFYRAAKKDTCLSMNIDIILLWSGLAHKLLVGEINAIKGWWSATSQLIWLQFKYQTLTRYFGLSGYPASSVFTVLHFVWLCGVWIQATLVRSEIPRFDVHDFCLWKLPPSLPLYYWLCDGEPKKSMTKKKEKRACWCVVIWACLTWHLCAFLLALKPIFNSPGKNTLNICPQGSR